MVTFIAALRVPEQRHRRDGLQAGEGRVTSKRRTRGGWQFCVDGVYTLHVKDEGVRWVRGNHGEDAAALRAQARLVGSR
jgi:hypothetical protein